MQGTMLIVDDNKMNREILKMLFEDEYVLLEAENGQEAITIAEGCNGNIDVILLDIIMPGMSGLDVLKERKNNDSMANVPVVVITSSESKDDQVKAFELGANDFVNKPFIPELVVTRVNNVVTSYQRMKMIEVEAERLKIKSEIDQMTGIYNKDTTEYMINSALRNSTGQLHGMLVVDIDNFKVVNDTSGHLEGDHVIKIVADLLASNFRKSDIVGRVGGDEFVVFMQSVPSMDIVRKKANELIMLLKYKPNLTIPENVTLSIGVASNDRQDMDYSKFFAMADSALRDAKDNGRACYREYGIEYTNVEDENKQAVMLMSRSRSTCSRIYSAIPQALRIIEVLSLKDLEGIKQEKIDKTIIIFADVEDYENDSKEFWESLTKYPWLDTSKVIAICQEGNMQQYAAALEAHVADILTSPLDGNATKRSIERQLSLNGITDIYTKK